jgi:ESCRT-I complex subunit VPS28
MDHPAALHRINVGVPATVEHSSEAGPETGKWVAETTQVSIRKPVRLSIDCSQFASFIQSFITFMDALRLKMYAKDQLHPILQQLMTGYARFKGSKDWEGRSRMVSWCVQRTANL